MNIFMAHNFYKQAGGEDRSFAAESAMLEMQGHQVHRYTIHNNAIDGMGRLKLGQATIWNRAIYNELRALFRREQFDIAHFQNPFPLISPAAYYAAQAENIPVVQSLRNYRLMCPNAIFFREGQVCEDCAGKTPPWPAVIHSCYRGSRLQTLAVVSMLTIHRFLKTWKNQVDQYIALTQFAREKFIHAGLDPERVVVKPNFVQSDPGVAAESGNYSVFVGRLTLDKGVWTLIRAWQSLPDIPLKVVGTGPLLEELRNYVQNNGLSSVEIVGFLEPAEAMKMIKGARFLIFPSEWYETFGRVAIESFACGVPVVASGIGAIADIVTHEKTGLHFEPGNAQDLSAKVIWMYTHPEATAEMGRAARREYEQKYTAEHNYEMLMQIYSDVIERKRKRQRV